MKKKLLSAAIASALVAPMTATAIEHSVSGHVNRLIRFADDGKASEIQQLDNSASQTRIRWRGSGDIGRGMKAGILIETGVSSSNSSSAQIKSCGDGVGTRPCRDNDTAFNIRHSRLDFSGRWGQIQLGHTSPSGDGFSDQNQSGATIASGGFNTGNDYIGGITLRTKGGGNVTRGGAGITAGSIGGRRDPGRRDVLRYDSPTLGPVFITASVSNDEYFDIAAYGDTALGGGNLKFSGGYARGENRDTADVWGISGSYLFSQGTNIQLTYSEQDYKGAGEKSGKNFAFTIGHKWGNNAVEVGYNRAEDVLRNTVGGVDRDSVGVGFVHSIPKPGVELYGGFQWIGADFGTRAKAAYAGGNGIEDVFGFYVGSRIQFD